VKRLTSTHSTSSVSVLAPVPDTKELSPALEQPEGYGLSAGPLPLTPSGPNIPSATATIQSQRPPPPAAELPGVQEEPEQEKAVETSQEPLGPPPVHAITEEPYPRDTSPLLLDLQTTIPSAEPGDPSLALIHSLQNATSRRVQPARYRPVGASDATTEGVDSSIIEAAEKSRTIKPIIPHGMKFLLYNGPAKEGEKEVKRELSAGQRAGYYGEKNGEGEVEDMPSTEFWVIEGWDALAEGDVRGEGHAPMFTNGVTLDSSVVSAELTGPMIYRTNCSLFRCRTRRQIRTSSVASTFLMRRT
jgi:hypothetical protein